ncbi:MAG: M23 family metallopeptidase [Candidatus Moranbacteria bacterium]|nr:M23 family metallopeptidase [Candidatus Moranbacteria bacterium]
MRKRTLKVIVLLVLVVIGAVFSYRYYRSAVVPISEEPVFTTEQFQDAPGSEPESVNRIEVVAPSNKAFAPPLSRAAERVTKKPFGVHITKAASPVQPERFSGYHTGTDFEVFPDETDTDVGISAICDGVLLMKRSASGYGGVAAQSCTYDGRPITVVYGHLRLSSIRVKVGEPIAAGDFLGNLGAGYSLETDGERKHLHLGIHGGDIVDIRGYVTTVRQLSDWMDPYELIRSQQ